MKISFCTQIKNRLYQFKQVFFDNLQEINNNPNTEWIIVDINSTDKLNDFIKPYINNQIRYYQSMEQLSYSIPIAKNFSVRLSSGDYVFNLDADNYIDNVYNDIIYNQYIPIRCNEIQKGVFGRIGCLKTIFQQVGGYDESFYQAAYHENDLLNRCLMLGYDFKNIICKKYPIENSKLNTIKNMNTSLTWLEMLQKNTDKAQHNQINQIINPNQYFTQCRFLFNFTDIIKLTNIF